MLLARQASTRLCFLRFWVKGSVRVANEAFEEGVLYFSLKPPPTSDPFLITETVASSNPHVDATLKVAARKIRRKDSSWLGICMMSYAIACRRMLEGHSCQFPSQCQDKANG